MKENVFIGKGLAVLSALVLMIAVLYLLYRESGDRELLIMMGAMFLL